MTREEFVDLLARAVAEERLTEAAASELLAQFDAGEIDEAALPLPLSRAVGPVTEEENGAAWLALLALLALAGGAVASLTPTQRVRLAETLQDRYEAQAATLAGRLASGSVRQWHQQAAAAVIRHHLQQAQLGRGRPLTPGELAGLDRLLREGPAADPLVYGQLEYLAAYAETAAVWELQGEQKSEGYHANRLAAYGGLALGLFYLAKEEEQGQEEGWVVRYEARDDGSTCSPCAEAEGYYLIGDGPFPGDVCRGGSRCRCKRDVEYNPAEYQRLTGRAA